MYKIAVIGDWDSIYGFATLGMDTFPVTDPAAAGQKIIFINLIHTIPVFVRPFSDRSQTSEHYSICTGNSKLAEPAFFLFLYMKLPRLYNSSDFCKNSEVII